MSKKSKITFKKERVKKERVKIPMQKNAKTPNTPSMGCVGVKPGGTDFISPTIEGDICQFFCLVVRTTIYLTPQCLFRRGVGTLRQTTTPCCRNMVQAGFVMVGWLILNYIPRVVKVKRLRELGSK